MLADIRVELRLHPNVRKLEEEWSGITDPAIRRKLQNRLNQRAARQRKSGQKDHTRASVPARSRITGGNDQSPDREDLINSCFEERENCDSELEKQSFPTTKLLAIRSTLLKVDNYSQPPFPLPADHLLSLIYYNVFRAFVINIELVGLPFELMCRDDTISTFVGKMPDDASFQKLPPGLQPTSLQRTVAHHPMWDIFPDPTLRDNVLAIYDEEIMNEDDFCLDICGHGMESTRLGGQSSQGVIVWGDPWDLQNWEVTESFARKWSFLIKDAVFLLVSTNKWRRRRDEPPLNFD